MAVLQYVAALRGEHLSRNAVALRLRETRFGESETLVQAAEVPTNATETPADAAQVLALAQYVETRLQASQRSLDERLQALERKQTQAVNGFVYGMIVGFSIAIVLLAIAFALQTF